MIVQGEGKQILTLAQAREPIGVHGKARTIVHNWLISE